MEWTEALKKTIEYVEQHLTQELDYNALGKEVGLSSFYLQKGFKVMTGITITEYVRNRRLYLAAMDLIVKDEKVIDVALKYGYDSPESFTRAFTRFHGISPMGIKKNSSKIKTYLPLKITISIEGGDVPEYSVERMEAFRVIGVKRSFDYDTCYQKIPLFWEEFFEACGVGEQGAELLKHVQRYGIGEFGICIDTTEDVNGFDYMIAGRFDGTEIQEGFTVYELPEGEWVKFRCVGPLAGNFQSLNTRIFKEWLPGNNEFVLATDINLEWYSHGDTASTEYESGIWIPVKRKQ